MTQKQNAPTSRKTSESATQTQTTGADSTQLQMFTAQAMADKSEKVRDSDKPAKPLKFSPRQLRAIDALLANPYVERIELDKILGSTNCADTIMHLRRKLGEDAIETELHPVTNAFGEKSQSGRYSLTPAGRAALQALEVAHA